jgi:polysaccharide deacetylase 2 family uncharacterized protein YibQ
MAKVPKKRSTSRKKRRPRKKKVAAKYQLLKIVIGLTILLVLVVSAGVLAHHLLLRDPRLTSAPNVIAYEVSSEGHLSKPRYEIFHDKVPFVPAQPDKPRPIPPGKKPLVAIIIDDIGYDRRLANKFIDLDAVLTFSMLPQAPFNRRIIAAAHAKGIEIMLHLPLEPHEYPQVNPGPGALLMSMTPDELIRQLVVDIASIPHIKGVNNHMGSRMTASPPQMRQIFTVLRKKNLYFIDSRTTAESMCRPSAKLIQLPFAERDIFIDHFQEHKFIRKQLTRLVKQARRQGQAVGIAHPHEITLEALRESLPQLKKQVTLVPASKVVQKSG